VIHSILAVYFFKGTSPRTVTGRERGINISGVDFWHAVEFSRNGRFLRTHPHGLSSGRFPSCFQHYQIRFPFRFRSEFISSGQLGAFAYSIALRLSFGESDFIRSF
jgi:hypothetical protein